MSFQKKLTAFLLISAVTMNIGITSIAFNDTNDSVQNNAIEVVSALGIMAGYEDGSFKPDNTVTRAEFAQILSQLYNKSDSDIQQKWAMEFFKREKEEIALKTPNEVKTKFNDVPDDFWAYQYIENAVNYGLMNGISNSVFEPASELKYEDAIKALVIALGYSIKANMMGGFPVGYISQANSLGINNGVTIKMGETLKRSELARIFYNSLDVQLLQRVSYGMENKFETLKDDTFLTKLLHMGKIEGQMTENDTTSLTGLSTIGRNQVVIGGEVFKLSDDVKDYSYNIGRYVKAYYIDNESDIDEIIYMSDSKGQDIIKISPKNLDSYSNYKFSYYDESKAAQEFASIRPGSPVIYNGVALLSYDSDTFSFSQGDITLISDGRNEYSLVIVNDYSNFIVSGIDTESYTIYNKAADNDGATDDFSIVLNENDSKQRIKIINTAGKQISFADIMVGDVLSIAHNGLYSKVIVSNNVISKISIDEIRVENNGQELFFGNEKYIISDYYFQAAEKADIKVGDVVTIFLDAFGEIAWITVEPKGTLMTACLVEVGRLRGVEQNVQIKIFNSMGKVQVFDTPAKIKIDTASGDSKILKSDAAFSMLSTLSGSLIRYSLNDEKKINFIELPLTNEDYSKQSKVYKMFETTSPTNEYPFKVNFKTFGGQVYVNDSTLMFSVPSNTKDETGYFLIKFPDLSNDMQYQFTAYSATPDTVRADYLVIKNLVPSISHSDRGYFVVSKISEAIGVDGQQLKKVTGWLGSNSGSAEVTLYGDYNYISNGQVCTAFDNAYDIPTNKRYRYSVKPGDVIKYLKDTYTGYVKDVQIYYKADAINPASPSGAKGWLVGTTGKYNPNDVLSNPFTANNLFVPTLGGRRFNSGNMRLTYGSVYVNKSGFITVTTQDLSSQNYVGPTDEWVVESYDANMFKITTIEYGGKEIVVKSGNVSDIKSFKQVGKNCSRVIAITSSGDPTYLIVINGQQQ